MTAQAQAIPDIPERVDYWLTEWARYDRTYQPQARLGYPRQVKPFVTGGESSRWDDWATDEEKAAWLRNCKTLETLIFDLPAAQSCSVRHIYLGEPWRFPRDNCLTLLERAAASLLISMNRTAIY